MKNDCVLYGLERPRSCSALTDTAYHEALRNRECGTELCPFYKTEKQQAEQENACRERLAKKGLGYYGLVTGYGIDR